MRHIYFCLLTMVIPSESVIAQSIYSLPEDRSEIEFECVVRCSDLKWVGLDSTKVSTPLPLRAELTVNSSLILRSVGREELDGKAFRWIEIKSTQKPVASDTDNSSGRILILKLLVPEENFGDGHYPFSQVKRAYCLDIDWANTVDPTSAERVDENPKRLAYEVDRFLPDLPIMPKDARRANDQTIETELGSRNCWLAEFESSYDGKLSGGTSGKWIWRGQYRVWVDSASPFGLVALRWKGNNIELDDDETGQSMRIERSVRLIRVGKTAISELPECR